MASDRAKLRQRVVASLQHRPPVDRAIVWPAEGQALMVGFAGKCETGYWVQVVDLWLLRPADSLSVSVADLAATSKRFVNALKASRLPRDYRLATAVEVRAYAWVAYRDHVMAWLDRQSRARRSDHPARKVLLQWSREGARFGVYVSEAVPEVVPLRNSINADDRKRYWEAPADIIAMDESGDLYFVAQVPRGRAGAWCVRHGLRLYPDFRSLMSALDGNWCDIFPAEWCVVFKPWTGDRPPGWPVPLPEAPDVSVADSVVDNMEGDDDWSAGRTVFAVRAPLQ